MRIQDPTTLSRRMLYHVQIRGGARLHNSAWDMMVTAAYVIWVQWTIIIGLLAVIAGLAMGILPAILMPH